MEENVIDYHLDYVCSEVLLHLKHLNNIYDENEEKNVQHRDAIKKVIIHLNKLYKE